MGNPGISHNGMIVRNPTQHPTIDKKQLKISSAPSHHLPMATVARQLAVYHSTKKHGNIDHRARWQTLERGARDDTRTRTTAAQKYSPAPVQTTSAWKKQLLSSDGSLYSRKPKPITTPTRFTMPAKPVTQTEEWRMCTCVRVVPQG